VIARDVTAEKALSSSVQASEDRFRTLVSNITARYRAGRSTTRGQPEFVSDAIEAITGYPAADFVSGAQSLAALVHPDDLDRVKLALGRSARRAESFGGIYRIVHRDGEVRYVAEQGRVIWNDDHSTCGSTPP